MNPGRRSCCSSFVACVAMLIFCAYMVWGDGGFLLDDGSFFATLHAYSGLLATAAFCGGLLAVAAFFWDEEWQRWSIYPWNYPIAISALMLASAALMAALDLGANRELDLLVADLAESVWLPVTVLTVPVSWLGLYLGDRVDDHILNLEAERLRKLSALSLALTMTALLLDIALFPALGIDIGAVIAGWHPWMWLLIGISLELMLLEAFVWRHENYGKRYGFDRVTWVYEQLRMATVPITGLAVAAIVLDAGHFFAGWQAWMWLPVGAGAKLLILGGFGLPLRLWHNRNQRLKRERDLERQLAHKVEDLQRQHDEAQKAERERRARAQAAQREQAEQAMAAERREQAAMQAAERKRFQAVAAAHPWKARLEAREALREAIMIWLLMRRLVDDIDSRDDIASNRVARFQEALDKAEQVVMQVEQQVEVIARNESDRSLDILARGEETELDGIRQRIRQVREEIENERDPYVKQRSEKRLASLLDQERSFQTIAEHSRRALAHVETVVENLGLTFSRMVQLRYTGGADGRFARLSQDLEADSRDLQDYITTVYEAQASHRPGVDLLDALDDDPD